MYAAAHGCRAPASVSVRPVGGVALRARGARGPQPPKALFENLYKNVINVVKKGSEAKFAPLDRDSTGGLGGVTDDVFGPLVRPFLFPAGLASPRT